MLTGIPFRPISKQNFPYQGIFVLASLLIGIGSVDPRSLLAENPPTSRVLKFDPPEDMAEPEEKPEVETEMVETDDPALRVIGNGFGTIGQGGYLGGKTFGRNDSITPLEYMPYLLTDEHFIFTDLRGFVTNRSQLGGNFGLGYRRLFEERNAWAGASFWYDADQSTGKMFQQVGLSFEGLIQQFEVRSNIYLPFTSSQTIANSINGATIVGNQLMFSRTTDIGTALRGVDAEVGYSQPILDHHVVRGFVGAYHFDGGSTAGVNGVKARIEGVINNTITAQALFTHDNLYGNNLMVGVSMQFPFGSNHPNTGWTRNTPSPFRFVERNYNVIVDQVKSDPAAQVAVDPLTGLPYNVEQVYAPASGPISGTPDGTAAHPYATVAAAQAAGGNVIYVQSGSVLTTPITLAPGQHLFGQGNFTETLATVGGGNVQLPNLLQAGQPANNGMTPIIQNVTGTGVTLASNSEVAGFNITGSTGNGVSGTGVSGVSIHDLIFGSIGGDAINLANSSGNANLANIQVNSATGNGIVFNGGTPNITFSGGGDTISASGNGFVLQNLTGGTVAVNNLMLSNVGGNGLVINSVATGATFNNLSVSQSGANNTGGAAVAISGNTGGATYRFTGNTTITSPDGPGFTVSGTDAIINVANLSATSTSSSNPAISLVNATSPITFGNLSVNTQNTTGLYANNVTSLLVNGGTFTALNGPAMDVESSGFNAQLKYVSVNGGPYGIKLAGSTGSFVISGSGSPASGGTIQNTTTAGVLINSFGSTSLSRVNFVNNAVAIQSTGSTALTLANLNFTGSTGYAIDSLNDQTVSLGNSTFTGNGAVGGGTVRIQANTVGTYTTNIEANTITDPNGSAIQLLTQAGAAGSTLTTQILTNTIYGYGSGGSLISTNWNGPMTSTITGNTLYAYASNMTAISLQDTSTTGAFTANIYKNTIIFDQAAATGGTGIWVVDGQSGVASTGTNLVEVYNNEVEFVLGTGGTGLRFGLYNTSNTVINTNTIADFAGGATGMLFDGVGANTNMILGGNIIGLKQGDMTTHRGIIFSQVTPTLAFDTQPNSASNWVYYAATSQTGFSMPAGTGSGGIILNGNYVPAP